MEGLLRRYKISQISDNTLSEEEQQLAEYLDNSFKDLIQVDDSYYRVIDSDPIFTVGNVEIFILAEIWDGYKGTKDLMLSWINDLYNLNYTKARIYYGKHSKFPF